MANNLSGKLVSLRPANQQDRKQIFEWLTQSDITASVLGSPEFPDNPIPTYPEFLHDYAPHFFDGSRPLKGRCFIIEVNLQPVGQINYNDIDETNQEVELDIWLAASSVINKGYGTDAILTVCKF